MANVTAHLHVRGDPQAVALSVEQAEPLSVSIGGTMFDRGADLFDGPYIVVPSTVAQTLPTTGYRMAHDVDVTAIPYLTTTNEAGGTTATIAS